MKYIAFFCILGIISSCNNEVPNKVALSELEGTIASPYLEKGRKIVASTFSLLSSTLKEKIESEGAAAAVTYCNLTAMSLTDSIALIENAKVKRTSLKWRNPSNKPTEWEQTVLKAYQTDVDKGEEVLPKVYRLSDNKIMYTAPILMMPLCTKCHGKSIENELKVKLKTLYPNDMAKGYESGDLRGMWSIILNN